MRRLLVHICAQLERIWRHSVYRSLLALLLCLFSAAAFAQPVTVPAGTQQQFVYPFQQNQPAIIRTVFNALTAPTTGTLVNASYVVTGLGSTLGVQLGDGVSGTGITTGSIVVAILSSASIEISNPATTSASETLTFSHSWMPQPQSTWFRVKMVGGGGGGGCGGASSGAASGGGGGGGSAYVISDWISIADMQAAAYPAALPIPIVAGAGGAACVSGSTPGNGVTSYFNGLSTTLSFQATGGGAASNGAAATGSGGGASLAVSSISQTSIAASGATGGTANRGGSNGGSAVAGTNNSNIYDGGSGGGSPATGGIGTSGGGAALGPGGGGSGGGCTALCAATSNGGGTNGNGYGYNATGGIAGGATPTVPFSLNCMPGVGGPGGASSAAGTGQTGQAGGYGAGGGGGGATDSGTVGNGGAGGAGQVCVEEM